MRGAPDRSRVPENGCDAIQPGALLMASLIAFAAAVGWIVWKSELIRHPLTTGIAVLPFENLSEQREDAAAFVDGVQDDILTKLARIADLKVISRTQRDGIS